MDALAGNMTRYFGRLVVAISAALSVACATVPSDPTPLQSAALEHDGSRAERVFLYQSRVADALLDHYPLVEYFEQADPAIVAAEARMTEYCSPLTRAALSRLEGEEPPLTLRLLVFASISECESAARTIDHLLQIENGSGSVSANTDPQAI